MDDHDNLAGKARDAAGTQRCPEHRAEPEHQQD
jgi:hypothetical protein